MNDRERTLQIKSSSLFSAIANAVLAVIKILTGLSANSLALTGDGIDSAMDVITSMITFFTATFAAAPPDGKHPWGHERAETLSTKTLSIIIFFAGAQLSIQSIKNIISPHAVEIPDQIAIYVTLISIAVKSLLSFYKFRAGKKADSPMLIADAKNMRNDIVISFAVLLGIMTTRVFQVPLVDGIVALLVSFWIIKMALNIFLETSAELMDSIKDYQGLYQKMFDAAEKVEGVENPHKARIRKINRFYLVDLDIEVDGNLTVAESHEIILKVEEEIKKSIENIYDIMIHVEPAGASEHPERFGLNRKNLWK